MCLQQLLYLTFELPGILSHFPLFCSLSFTNCKIMKMSVFRKDHFQNFAPRKIEKNHRRKDGVATAVKYKQAQIGTKPTKWQFLGKISSDFFLVPILLFSSFHLHVSEKKLFTHFRSHKASMLSMTQRRAAPRFERPIINKLFFANPCVWPSEGVNIFRKFPREIGFDRHTFLTSWSQYSFIRP